MRPCSPTAAGALPAVRRAAVGGERAVREGPAALHPSSPGGDRVPPVC